MASTCATPGRASCRDEMRVCTAPFRSAEAAGIEDAGRVEARADARVERGDRGLPRLPDRDRRCRRRAEESRAPAGALRPVARACRLALAVQAHPHETPSPVREAAQMRIATDERVEITQRRGRDREPPQ